MKIVCISDTHSLHLKMTHPIPDGDMIVHAGDFTNVGRFTEILHFRDWYGKLPHKNKLLICGNHEREVSEETQTVMNVFNEAEIDLIHDETIELDGVRFFGQPRTPEFFDWGWMYQRGAQAKKIWDQVPIETDVLLCHGPPFGYGDLCPDFNNRQGPQIHVGCGDQVEMLKRTQIPFVVCGHIHESYGVHMTPWGTVVVNASTCTSRYQPTNRPLVIDFDLKTRTGTVSVE